MKREYIGHDENAPICIWLGNLRKYNEGELSGEWVALPLPLGVDFEDVFEALGIDPDRDEYHVPDWECNVPGIEYSEWPDLWELNEWAIEWERLEPYEQDSIRVRAELCGEDFETAQRNKDDAIIWHGCRDMADVAEQYCEECGILESIPENLRYYFDFEAFGRDMEIEGCFDYMPEFGCMVEAY